MDRKTKQETLVRALQERKASFEVTTMVDLLQIQLEGTKNKLLTCASDEFTRLQGEAQAYDKLLRLMARPSLTGQQPKE